MYPTLKIVVLKNHSNKDNRVTIYLQYIQNRRVNRISIKKMIPLEYWTGQAPKYISNSYPNAKALNLLLNKKLNLANEIILKAELENRSIDFPQFKISFLGHTDLRDLHYYYDQYINLKSNSLGPGSIRQLKGAKRKLHRYKNKIWIQEVTKAWIHNYETYLIHEIGNSPNTVGRDLQIIKSVINVAIEQGACRENPFNTYKFKKIKAKSRGSISLAELNTLDTFYHNTNLEKWHKRILKKFLFSCYTGMDFGDLKHFDYKHISEIQGQPVIQYQRRKTKVNYIVPINDKALRLIDIKKEEGLVFHTAEHWKSNNFLREVISLAGINTKATFHSARHTFGTLSINAGIPREIVRKMMGHSSNKMTDHYAILKPDTIINTAIKLWGKQLI